MHNHLAYLRRLPPGPRTPSLVQLWRWLSDARGFFEENRARHGDVFTVRPFGMRPTVVFATPRAARDLIRAPAEQVGHAVDIVRITLGERSVLLLNGDPHLQMRSRLNTAFLGNNLIALGPIMERVIGEAVDQLQPGSEIKLLDWARKVALHVIMQSLFGVEQGPLYDRLFDNAIMLAEAGQRPSTLITSSILPQALSEKVARGEFDEMERRVPDPLWRRPLSRHPLSRASRGITDDLLAHVREVRGGKPVPSESILAHVLRQMKEGDEYGSDLDVASALTTLLLAGHDTTAVAFAWAMQHLLREPDVLDRVRESAASAYDDGHFDLADAAKARYLDAVVGESMRLTPVVPGIPRTILKPTTIDGVDLPAGVVAEVLTFAVHQNPEQWPEPLRFSPEQILESKPRPEGFLAFGGGYRRCLGASYAVQELKYMIAIMASRLELELLDEQPLAYQKSGVITHPRRGTPVRVLSNASGLPKRRAVA